MYQVMVFYHLTLLINKGLHMDSHASTQSTLLLHFLTSSFPPTSKGHDCISTSLTQHNTYLFLRMDGLVKCL